MFFGETHTLLFRLLAEHVPHVRRDLDIELLWSKVWVRRTLFGSKRLDTVHISRIEAAKTVRIHNDAISTHVRNVVVLLVPGHDEAIVRLIVRTCEHFKLLTALD
jgi:hypothetical protein